MLLAGHHAAQVVTLLFSLINVICMELHHTVVIRYSTSSPRWNSAYRGEGGYTLRSSNQSAATRRAQLSVAAKAVMPADLLNHVNT